MKENEIIKKELQTESKLRNEQINNLEQYGRRNNIRVSGLDFDYKYESSQETTDGIVRILKS